MLKFICKLVGHKPIKKYIYCPDAKYLYSKCKFCRSGILLNKETKKWDIQ